MIRQPAELPHPSPCCGNVVMIDEYDTPLIEANNRGYYTQVRDFLQVFLGDGLKDNKALSKAVVTDILRVAKESLFSGLNNLTVSTVLNQAYANRFGFTPQEVEDSLQRYNLAAQLLAEGRRVHQLGIAFHGKQVAVRHAIS